MNDPGPHPDKPIPSRVQRKRGFRISVAWIFPLLALGVCGWIVWTNWKSEGPLIQVHFSQAPGIQAGKSVLVYRGVTAGSVKNVHLDPNLRGVVVTIRLKAFAAELAVDGSDFWVEQPVISLREISGLESIVEGNSIHARRGSGAPRTSFEGLAAAPLLPLDQPALSVWLTARDIPFLDRGSPVYHRGVQVGTVRLKGITDNDETYLQVIVDEDHRQHVREGSKFWVMPATKLDISATGASLQIAGLEALIDGGIAFESFGDRGPPVADNSHFPLAPNETVARASGPSLTISFENGHGLREGQTSVAYLGQPVGVVTRITPDVQAGLVKTDVRLYPEFADLATEDATFTLIRPQISLEGVSGLDTIITGPYIAFEPGRSDVPSQNFVGRSISGAEWERAAAEKDGIEVFLEAADLPSVDGGAPIYYRGLIAGRVLETLLGPDGKPTLHIVVQREFRHAVRQNTRFWRVPATSVQLGAGVLSVDVQGLAALVQGGIAFETFDAPGQSAEPNSVYALFPNEHVASATSPPFRISLPTGRGIVANRTELRYLGLSVGYVSAIEIRKDHVDVEARLRPEFNFLRLRGSKFAVVEPSLSLQGGAAGLSTLLTGVFIECVPGSGPGYADYFDGTETTQPEVLEDRGFRIVLTNPDTRVGPGAAIYYRDVQVGQITEKNLSPDADSVILIASIHSEHSDLITVNSQFWEASALDAKLGFIKLQVQAPSLIDPSGRIAFSNPPGSNPPAPEGTVFPLLNKQPTKRFSIWPFGTRQTQREPSPTR